MCEICCEKPAEYPLFSCHHTYCKQCLQNYFTTKIFEGGVLSIRCPRPDCFLPIQDIDVRTNVSYAVFERYKHFKMIATLSANPNCRWCPMPDCSTPVIADTKKREFPSLTCPKCRTRFCFNCNEKWHGKKSCQQNYKNLKKKGEISEQNEKWKVEHNTKKCPRCRADIEKDQGCNHINCMRCSYQFCWLCMGQYTETHYETGACANKCFDFEDDEEEFFPTQETFNKGTKSSKSSKTKRVVVTVTLVTFLAIPALVGFTIGVPFYGCYRLSRHVYSKRQKASGS